MELEMVKKGLDYAKKRSKLVYALGVLGVTSYSAYKIYHLPAVVEKRQRLLKLIGAFVKVIEMVSDSAEAIGIVSKELKEFIQSDSDRIPKSLKQVSKISSSDEVSESLIRITRALTVGFLRGYRHETARTSVNMTENFGFSDRVLDKLFSDAGSGFASVVVGSFAKNMVMAFYTHVQHNGMANSYSFLNIDLESEKCKALIGDCVKSFVTTAVTVYLDKRMHINTYDEIFSGLTNPKHETQVRDMLVLICNDAVETFVKTSHTVLTYQDSIADTKLNNSSYLTIDFEENSSKENKRVIREHLISKKLKGMKKLENTRFLLDVTGRVTFETVRSFLKILLEKISECLRRNVDIIHEEMVDKGVEALEYVTRQSSSVVTVCLSLCIHILNSPWILVPT